MSCLILFGRRSIDLLKCPCLILSAQNGFSFSSADMSFVDCLKGKNFTFSAFSSASYATDVRSQDGLKGKTFTISYLVSSLGLARKLAESISRKVSFDDKTNPDSVLSLLRSHGFNDSQISNIIRVYPQLLILDAESSISPKLEFLKSREGVSTSELTEVLSKVPKILARRKGESISLYYDYVKDILQDTRIVVAQESINRNVLALRESGVPQKLISHLLQSTYGLPVYGNDKFQESVKKVVAMGFDPSSTKFVQALRVVYKMSDKTREEKFQVFKRLGFQEGDVWGMFKKWPCYLQYSETKIVNSVEGFLGLGFSRDEFVMMMKRSPQLMCLSADTVKEKTEFVVKQMNWPLKDLVKYPLVYAYSMEKRIVPRCNVIKALMAKGLLGSGLPAMSSVLVCTDEMFLKRYVKKHDDKELVAELLAICTEKNKGSK